MRSCHPPPLSEKIHACLQEVQALAAAGVHDHIVRYYGSWLEDQGEGALHFYIQLEKCETSLGHRFSVERAPLKEAELVNILRQVSRYGRCDGGGGRGRGESGGRGRVESVGQLGELCPLPLPHLFSPPTHFPVNTRTLVGLKTRMKGSRSSILVNIQDRKVLFLPPPPSLSLPLAVSCFLSTAPAPERVVPSGD